LLKRLSIEESIMKNSTTRATLTLLLCALTIPGIAGAKTRKFLPSIGIPRVQGQVTTVDGKVYQGLVWTKFANHRGSSHITVETADGERFGLHARQVEQLLVPANNMIRMAMAEEGSGSIEAAIKTDYETIHDAVMLVFDPVTWPKTDKVYLLQLLNPGYDQRIRVYPVELSKEVTFFSARGIPLFGEDDGTPRKIKEHRYDNEFLWLYGDCPRFLAERPKRDRDFKYFSEDLRLYDQLCRR
jgi:hypothetical protein